jgi:hypothetical protein
MFCMNRLRSTGHNRDAWCYQQDHIGDDLLNAMRQGYCFLPADFQTCKQLYALGYVWVFWLGSYNYTRTVLCCLSLRH